MNGQKTNKKETCKAKNQNIESNNVTYNVPGSLAVDLKFGHFGDLNNMATKQLERSIMS